MNHYDIIIVGAGITGLYLANKIKDKSVLIIEKSHYLGGRIYTYEKKINNKVYFLEGGAARFSNSDSEIIDLISDLGLANKKEQITSDFSYWDSKDGQFSGVKMFNFQLMAGRLLLVSKFKSNEDLCKKTFYEFAIDVLGKKQADLYGKIMGFYTEFKVMNAADAVKQMEHFAPWNIFYTMKNGLTEVIEKLEKKLVSKKNISIKKNNILLEVNHSSKNTFLKVKDEFDKEIEYNCDKLILACDPLSVKNIRGISTIQREISKRVHASKLFRIYAIYPTKDKKSWFSELPKLTTDNPLRMFLPIDYKNGSVLISYTDDKDVDFWEKIYKKDKKPFPLLKNELHKQANILFNNKLSEKIPEPLLIIPALWNAGCYAYKKNYFSDDSMKFFLKPYVKSNIYMCNSGLSNQQAWMNGGLKMANKVLDLI